MLKAGEVASHQGSPVHWLYEAHRLTLQGSRVVEESVLVAHWLSGILTRARMGNGDCKYLSLAAQPYGVLRS